MLSLPLRVAPDGRLERTDARDALLRLFRAMAATSTVAWPHARWFGLRELIEEANLSLQDQQHIADALNRALTELGVGWARVLSVTTAPEQPPGERRFRVTLAIGGGRAVHEILSV